MDGRRIVRSDDMEINAFGMNIRASGKTVVIILAAIFIFGMFAWHDWKSDQAAIKAETKMSELIHAVWFQSAVLIMPQESRGAMATQLPESVKDKAGMTERR